MCGVSFSLSLSIFEFSLWFLCWSIGCLRALFKFHKSVNFPVSFRVSCLTSSHCDQKSYFVWYPSSKIHWDLICGLSWKMSRVNLRRVCILWLLGRVFGIYLLGLVYCVVQVLYFLACFLPSFSFCYYEEGMEVPKYYVEYYIWIICFFHQFWWVLHHVFGGSLLLDVCMFAIITSSFWIDIFIFIKCPLFSSNNDFGWYLFPLASFEILSLPFFFFPHVEYDIPRCRFFLVLKMLGVLPGSVDLGLSLILENSQSTFLQAFLLFLAVFLLLWIFPISICCTFCN